MEIPSIPEELIKHQKNIEKAIEACFKISQKINDNCPISTEQLLKICKHLEQMDKNAKILLKAKKNNKVKKSSSIQSPGRAKRNGTQPAL